jgi:hypothetical protein
MAVSDALAWRLNSGGTADDLYKDIRTFLGASPDAATTQAAMAQYGISGEDVANATGGKSGGLLGGNILAGASWNSLNTTLGDQLTEATGQATTNVAVGGATTADTLNQLNTYLAGGGQFDPNATVYLQTGGVDFITGVDKDTVKSNINQIVKTLASQGVDVVLTGSPYAKSIDDVINNNFDPKVDQIFTDIARENNNVALVGIQGEILQNKKLLVDALHTNAEGTSIYNQAVIDSLSQFKNEVPSSTPQAIAQVQQSNTVATTPSVITQAANVASNYSDPIKAAEAANNIITSNDINKAVQVDKTTQIDLKRPIEEAQSNQSMADIQAAITAESIAKQRASEQTYWQKIAEKRAADEAAALAVASPAVSQTSATQTVDSLIKAGNLNPTQIASATGVSVGEILTKVASSIPQGQSITLGDTIIQPEYRVTGSGETQEIGNLETIYTSKTTGDVNYRAPVGSEYQQYNADGTFQRTGTTQKTANSFLGGLAEAFNDPVVQAIVLGLGGGGALGNALGLTGSTAQAVGTGLLKSGAAAAGGADIGDALKTGLLSGGLVYGGNLLNNYLTTGSTADVGLTERQFAIQDAKQLADQGLTATQIRDTLSSGGYNDAIIDRALTAITTTPVAIGTPVTDTSAVNITAPSNVSLNNVLSTIAATAPVAVSTPVTDGGTVKVTAPSTQMTTQQAIDLVNSQLAANLGTPANLATQTITAQKPATSQEIVNAITATLPSVTSTQAQNIAQQVITSNKPVTTQEVIAAITATLPALTTGTTVPTSTLPTTTITAQKPVTTQDIVNAIIATTPAVIPTSTVPTTTITAASPVTTPETINTIASTLTPTAVTPTPTTTTPTKETDPLKVAQLALAAAGLLGAGSALSSSGTPTGYDIVPVPESWKTPPKPSVAPFTQLPPINFGNRNLLMGTQWEKFLDPNYGQVPAPVQYSQPSNLSYNDLMGILGSRQGMPSASSLSINDVISGIQNQYGQVPTRTMG